MLRRIRILTTFLLSTGKCTFSLVTFVVELELMLLVSGSKAWESEREGCKALEQTNPESIPWRCLKDMFLWHLES